jgi:Rad3-related DNA helicase
MSGPMELEGFDSWYEGQEEIFSEMIEWYYGPKRFCGASIPTGSGKSVLAMALAKAIGGRGVLLTATKGLQDQMMKDFSKSGLVNVKGMSNYRCLVVEDTVDNGPCHDLTLEEPYICGHKVPQGSIPPRCPYYFAREVARESDLVTTNYAYYMALTNFSSGFGKVDLLIMDEGHQVFQTFESYLTSSIPITVLPDTVKPFPIGETWAHVQAWSVLAREEMFNLVTYLVGMLGHTRPGAERDMLSKRLDKARGYHGVLDYMAGSSDKWAMEVSKTHLKVTPLWPQEHANRLIYKEIPKVMIMSAVLTKKTMNLLGVEDDQMEFIESGSTYNPLNTRIRHIYTTRLTHKTTPAEALKVAKRVDEIVAMHPDKKGIVFTVSYGRRDYLMKHCDTRRFLTHDTGTTTSQVAKFRATSEGVLVSPTVTTGWDFPGSDCEFIVIVKIPFMDTRSPVVSERNKEDKEWLAFEAMQTLIQSAGRGTRSKEDTCNIYILDDNWGWFWKKYRSFAPEWFADRVRGSFTSLPA